jgi:hypothetical protein
MLRWPAWASVLSTNSHLRRKPNEIKTEIKKHAVAFLEKGERESLRCAAMVVQVTAILQDDF